MKLHELKAPAGSTKNRKRRGRGTATGQGKTGGRGMNGQNSRSGVEKLNGFEDGTVVTPEMLIDLGIVKQVKDGIKVLGRGELTKKITVQANKFSKSAVEKIEAAGGKAEVI